jgi:hypothetical protein
MTEDERAYRLIDKFEDIAYSVFVIPTSLYDDWSLLNEMRQWVNKTYGVSYFGVHGTIDG